MEERRTFWDYLTQLFAVFGITMIILTVFCLIVGENAEGYSSIFQLGKQGIACSTMLQFLATSALITGIRYIFFTDRLIKQMPVTLRIVCMVLSIIVLIGVFSYLFSWFPVDEWLPWVCFLVCFAICATISTLVSLAKEKAENKALAEALKRMKEKQHE